MNKNIHVVRVMLTVSDEKTTLGIAWLQNWSQRDRLKRAFKGLGISWGLGLVSVVIPLAHFILVPAFLLAGPFVAFYIYQTENMITGGTGLCPSCGQAFTIVKAPLKWPLNDLCSSCQTSVVIMPVGDHRMIEDTTDGQVMNKSK